MYFFEKNKFEISTSATFIFYLYLLRVFIKPGADNLILSYFETPGLLTLSIIDPHNKSLFLGASLAIIISAIFWIFSLFILIKLTKLSLQKILGKNSRWSNKIIYAILLLVGIIIYHMSGPSLMAKNCFNEHDYKSDNSDTKLEKCVTSAVKSHWSVMIDTRETEEVLNNLCLKLSDKENLYYQNNNYTHQDFCVQTIVKKFYFSDQKERVRMCELYGQKNNKKTLDCLENIYY